MKKSHLLSKTISSSLFLLLFVATACVDDKYDLSKDIDMTVGVGGGVSLPLGSTEKIMLTELIDTVETDIVKLDNEGNYSIFKEGSFTPENFEIGNLDISLAAVGEKRHYDFDLYNLSDDYDNLPEWIQQEMQKSKFPYIVHNEVDHETSFDIDQSVPEEMVRLRTLDFRNDVSLVVNVKIYSANHQSDDILEIVNTLSLKSDGEDGFLINVPEYIVFADENVTAGKLLLQGDVVYNTSTKALEYSKEYKVAGLDFSNYKNGYIPVEDGIISLHDTLSAEGFVDSDTVLLAYDNITHIQSVDFEVTMSINKMTVESVEGIFAPEIDPIKEVVDLDLGDDLDFLGDSYLDFNDPRVFVTFTNPVDARMFADARFAGYDKEGNKIENSDVAVNLVLEGNRENNLLISRYATELPGYTTFLAPTLNNLIKTIPDRIDVNVEARMDDSEYSTIVLGRSLGISGNYQVSLPLVFDEFSLVYTEEIEEVLGDDPTEVTDYVTDINSVTLAFEILNTVPAEFTPSIVAYDKNGRRLAGIKVDVVGAIAAGNGMSGTVVTEPVSSNIEINLSALNGELEELDKLDLKFEGRGSGRLNSNEYIQLKDINVTVNEDIVVDLN
ncbi:MAG: hypothetical protein E7088_05505 [Bacteroidales bacterium]|nr:hypothetical protein [Bacteroidales bacterium]